MERLNTVEITDISVSTADMFRMGLYLLFSSYLSDTVKEEGMLTVKRSTATDFPCHKCMVPKDKLPFCTFAPAPNLQRPTRMIEDLNTGLVEVD